MDPDDRTVPSEGRRAAEEASVENPVTAASEVFSVIQRWLAERSHQAPQSIGLETGLGELLRSEPDWLALQRAIFRSFRCVLSIAELRVLRTVGDLVREVQARSSTQPSGGSDDEASDEDHLRAEAKDESGYQTVRVFYATDRAIGPKSGLIQKYEARRGDGALSLGAAEVAIPHSHKFGEMEGPPWWQFFRSPDPRRHIVVLAAGELPEPEFWDRVRGCVGASNARDILLLIHGYNVSFEQGLRRAAQVVKDLNFHGAPVLYSWPSHGSVTSYSADEASVEWTVPHLRAFLRQLLEGAGAAQVHVIAHSMGNRAAVAALRELQMETLAPGAAQLSQFVLAAPDIDAGTFRQLAADFAHKAKRCTLYANSEDRALAASDWKHGGYARAGGGGDDLVVVPPIETIDATGHATDFLSHSYFAGSSPVIADLFYVIRSTQAEQRARLERRQAGELVYWRIAQ
jgi:esterase/lipase superfamily enzyme